MGRAYIRVFGSVTIVIYFFFFVLFCKVVFGLVVDMVVLMVLAMVHATHVCGVGVSEGASWGRLGCGDASVGQCFGAVRGACYVVECR